MNHTILPPRRHVIQALSLGLLLPLTARSQGLSLPYKPVPENAGLLADRAVRAAKDVEGVTLDYSHASLKHVDKTVLRFREQGLQWQQVGATLFVFGCYVGEVVVRNLSARWEMPNEKEQSVGFDWMGIRTSNGAFWDPINKVFKLLKNGEEDSVWYLYSVIESDGRRKE